MASKKLKQQIRDVLKNGYFSGPDELVDVSDVPEDSIHLVIVSRKFDGWRMKKKHDLIWAELMKHLEPDQWNKVSLSIGVSPEQLKAGC